MKLSAKARYRLRAITEIAKSYGGAPAKRKDIAEKQGLSDSYLENILIVLKNIRLIETTRGSNGGYVLCRPPSQISVLEIVEALEGQLDLVECVFSAKSCEKSDCVQPERSGARCRNYGIIPYRKRPYRICSIRKIRHDILITASNVIDKGNNFIRNRCFENVF
jgi:Rrf2 family protein